MPLIEVMALVTLYIVMSFIALYIFQFKALIASIVIVASYFIIKRVQRREDGNLE